MLPTRYLFDTVRTVDAIAVGIDLPRSPSAKSTFHQTTYQNKARDEQRHRSNVRHQRDEIGALPCKSERGWRLCQRTDGGVSAQLARWELVTPLPGIARSIVHDDDSCPGLPS